jgi:hypothetical protein
MYTSIKDIHMIIDFYKNDDIEIYHSSIDKNFDAIP